MAKAPKPPKTPEQLRAARARQPARVAKAKAKAENPKPQTRQRTPRKERPFNAAGAAAYAARCADFEDAPTPTPAVGLKKAYAPTERERIWPLVLEQLEAGLSLNKACAAVPGAPLPVTFMDWVSESPSTISQYVAARTKGYTMFAEQIHDISDTPHMGTRRVVREDGTVEVFTEDQLGHRRLQIDTRKWLLSKMLPKVFGDKQVIETNANEAMAAALQDIARRLPV